MNDITRFFIPLQYLTRANDKPFRTMKSTIFACLFALVPIACHAADLAKPVVLTFYKDGKDKFEWADATEYPTNSSTDRGDSPHKDDERYMGHYTFHSTVAFERVLYRQPPAVGEDTKVQDLDLVSRYAHIQDLLE